MEAGETEFTNSSAEGRRTLISDLSAECVFVFLISTLVDEQPFPVPDAGMRKLGRSENPGRKRSPWFWMFVFGIDML